MQISVTLARDDVIKLWLNPRNMVELSGTMFILA